MRTHPTTTALGEAIRCKRGGEDQNAAAAAVGISNATLSRIERGAHAPSAATARKLARWLGWSVERVLDAAEEPAGG